MKNVPEDMKDPIDGREFSKERYLFWRGKHQELAAKGWLFPTFPKDYGGGLSGDHEPTMEEEFQRVGVPRNFTNQFIFPARLVWGTEEQKQISLVLLLKSETTAWQKFTQPSSAADLANYQRQAIRDGDDWLFSAQRVFVNGKPRPQWGMDGPNYLFGPMLTDPDAPRHRNPGSFMVPVPPRLGWNQGSRPCCPPTTSKRCSWTMCGSRRTTWLAETTRVGRWPTRAWSRSTEERAAPTPSTATQHGS